MRAFYQFCAFVQNSCPEESLLTTISETKKFLKIFQNKENLGNFFKIN